MNNSLIMLDGCYVSRPTIVDDRGFTIYLVGCLYSWGMQMEFGDKAHWGL